MIGVCMVMTVSLSSVRRLRKSAPGLEIGTYIIFE